MIIARFNGGRIGLVFGQELCDLTDLEGFDTNAWPPVSAVKLIGKYADCPSSLLERARGLPRAPLFTVRLECPIDWPNKVIAFPANYHAHIEERRHTQIGLISTFNASGQGFFLKANSSLSGPSDPIVIPPLDEREVHHECELAIIIGKGGRGIAVEDALDHVFGYSCLVDVVVRGREERVMRKSFDTFCPLGPWIVSADEVPDPSNLNLDLTVNGQLRQQANTRDLIMDIPNMISMAASVMSLFPGDVIATGTPAGVGPLVPGDRLVSRIQHVGALELAVIQGDVGRHNVWTAKQLI